MLLYKFSLFLKLFLYLENHNPNLSQKLIVNEKDKNRLSSAPLQTSSASALKKTTPKHQNQKPVLWTGKLTFPAIPPQRRYSEEQSAVLYRAEHITAHWFVTQWPAKPVPIQQDKLVQADCMLHISKLQPEPAASPGPPSPPWPTATSSFLPSAMIRKFHSSDSRCFAASTYNK